MSVMWPTMRELMTASRHLHAAVDLTRLVNGQVDWAGNLSFVDCELADQANQ